MTVHLYAHRLSQPSRAAEILLRELDMPYAWHTVDFANGETRTDTFAAQINPLQTIPALVVRDTTANAAPFALGESHAILRYLCRTARNRDLAAQWYPSDDAERCAPVDLWMAWHHNHVRAYDMFHDIMNLHFTLPMLKYELQSTALKPLQDGLRAGLATLEHHLGHQKNPSSGAAATLCGGEQPTLADLVIACELYQIAAVGYRFDGFPQLARWLEAMANRRHFRDVSQEIDAQGQTIREQSGAYLDLAGAFS
ncbi:glutathione S-transferase family protein [Salinisphaera sp.]|uniref:glutathione S-transferase family protein n=1 Tax=Salinisphaera sp. TaxID=1914330 RepID=UPI000C67DD54|nr:glutathione S-transferase family protein [Salinisphaera sp.]MAS10947.1 glutathione S-transferase [Salinisphaera sp.]